MNEWNKVINGALQGGMQVAGALNQKANKDYAQSEFDTYKKGIMDQYNSLLQTNTQILSSAKDQLFNGLDPQKELSQNIQSMQPANIPQEQMPQDPLAGYNKLMDFQNKMTGNPYGEQYNKQAEGLYNTLLGKKNQPEYEVREIGGQLVRFDKNNPQKFEVVYGDKKPEKTVYNQKFYESQTPETIKNLTPDQLKEGYFYLPKELQDQAYQNQDVKQYVDNVLNQGDFAPKTTGIHRGGKIGSKTPPISYGLRDDKNDFDKLKSLNERVWSGEQLTDTETENYKVLQTKLGKKYNLDYEQLAKVTDKLQSATTPKEQNKIMQELQKGDYHNADQNTSQAQIDYDAERINQWVDYMQQIYDSEGYGEQWNTQKQNFQNELKSMFDRGSLTLKEYKQYMESYK